MSVLFSAGSSAILLFPIAGECFKEISQEYRISQLQADYQKSGTIISLSDNTEGDLLKHYKVVCR